MLCAASRCCAGEHRPQASAPLSPDESLDLPLYTKPSPQPGDTRDAPRHAEPSGVLITNLGTPAAPTSAAVRRYLAEFLSDPRVVELPRWLWLPVLHAVILRLRPRRH